MMMLPSSLEKRAKIFYGKLLTHIPLNIPLFGFLPQRLAQLQPQLVLYSCLIPLTVAIYNVCVF